MAASSGHIGQTTFTRATCVLELCPYLGLEQKLLPAGGWKHGLAGQGRWAFLGQARRSSHGMQKLHSAGFREGVGRVSSASVGLGGVTVKTHMWVDRGMSITENKNYVDKER